MIYLKKIVFYFPIWMALLAKGLSLENFDKCTNHNQCPENSICSPSACDGYTCRCREGYVSSDDKVQCLPVRRMGDRCDASNKCLSPFSLCEDSCFCNDLLEATQDGRCKDPLFRYVGETCWMDPCQPPALCSDEGMCVCPPGMRKLKNEEFWLNPMIITQCVENDFSVHSCKGKLLEIPAGLLPTTPTIAPMTKPATSPVPSTTSVQQPSIEPIKPPMAQFLSTMPLRPTTETLPDTTSVPLYKIIYPDRRFPRRAFEMCTNNTQCPENSRCRPRGCMGYVCICDEGYIASDNRHYCLKATKVGEPCNRLESKCMSPFSYCDGECRCLDVFEPTSDGRCKLPGIGFQGDTCSNSSCEYPAECLNGRCTCTGDYRPVSEEEFWVDPSDLRQCRKKSTSLTSCNGVVVPVPDEMKVSTTSTMKATTPLSSSASTEIQTTSTEPQTTSTEPQTTTEPETTTEPQTTSPEPQITTTEPQTTTTEPQTTTTEQQTITTEPQTTTTTTTTEPQTTTTTTDLRTTTEPQTTTTEPKTTTEPQITTTEPPITIEPQTTTTEPQTTTSTEPPTTSTDPPTTSTDPPTTSTEIPTTSIETPTTSTETTTASTELQTTSTESKSTSKEPQSTTSKTTTNESQTSTSAPTTTDPQTSSTIQQATDFKTTVTNQITSTKPQTTSSSKHSTTDPRTSTSQQATDTQTTTSSLTTQEETTTTIAQTLTNTGQDIPESTISTEFSKITTENHISTTLPQTTAFQSTTTTTTEQTTSEAQTTSTSSPEQQTTTTRTSTEKGNEWQSTLKQSVTITIPQTTTATSQITSGTLQNTLKSETTDREIQTTAQSEPTTTQSVTSTPSETTTEYGIPVTTTGVNTMKNPTINTHITESQAATTTSQTTPQIGTTASGQQTTKELQTASHSTTTEPENTTTRTTHISETTSGQQTTSRLQTTETMTSSSTSNMTENGMDRTTSATTTTSFTTIDKVSEGNLNDTNNAVKTNTTNYRENLTKSDTFSTTPIYVNSTLQRLSNGSEETFLVAFTTEVSTSTHNIQVASTMDMFQPDFNLTNIQYASTLETSTNYLTQKENNSSSDVKTVHFSPTPVISPSSDYVDATGHLSAITDSFNSIDIFVDTSYIQQDHNISIDNKSDMSALSTESDNTRSEMDLTTTHKVETFSFVGSSNEKLHKFTSTSGYIYSTANEIVSSKTQERVQSLQSIHLYASDSTIQTRQMKKDEEMSGLFSSSSPVDSKDISEINSLYGITTTPLYSSEIFESTGSVSPFTSMDTYGIEASSEIEDQFKSSLKSTSSQDRTPTSYAVDESHSFGSSYYSSTPSNMHTAISSEPDSDYVTESSTLELEIMPSRTISADKTPSGSSVTPIYNTKDLNEENTKLSKIVHAFLNNTYLQTSYTDVGDVSTSYTTFSENVLPTTDLLLETMTFHTKQTNVGENTSYANQENTESPSPSGMDITSIGSYQHSTSSAMPARHVTVTSTTAPIAHSLYISNATSHHVKAYENKSVLYDSVVAMSSSTVTSVPSVTSTTDNIIFIPSTKEDGKGVAYTNDVSQEVTVNEVKLDPRKPIKTIYQDLIYVVKRDPDKAQNPTVSKQDNLEGDLLYESEADKTLLNEEISNTDSRDNKTRSKDAFIGKTPSNTNSTMPLESDSILIIPSISQSSSNSSSVDQLQFGERINGISNYTSFQWDYFNSTSNVSFETVQPSYEAMTTSSLQSSDVVATTINGSTYLPRMNLIYTLTSDEGQSSVIVNDARNLFHSSSGYASITNSPSLSNNEIDPTAAASFSSSYSLQTPTSLPLLQMSNTIYNDKRSASASAISELHDIDATKSSVYSKNTNKSVLDPGFKWASTGGLLNTNTSVIFATWVDPSFSSTYISLNENLRLESSTRSSFSVTPSSSEVLALSDSLFQTSLSYNVDIRKHMNFSEYEMLNDSNIKDILHKSLYDDFTGARDQGANDEEDTTPASISTIGDMLHLQTKKIHSLSEKSHVDPSFDDAHWNSLDSQDLSKSSDHDSFHYTTESLMQRPSFHLEHQSFLGTEYPAISASFSKTRPLGTYDKSKIHSPISIDTKNTSSEYENTILPSDSIAMEEIPIPTNSIFTGIPSHILHIHKDNLTSSSNNISTTNSTVYEQDSLTNLQTSISLSNGTGMNFSREVILDDDFHSELFSNSKYLYSVSSEFSDSVDLRMVSSVTYDGLIFPTSSLGYITQEQTLSPSTILRRSDEILPELNSLTSTNENVIDKLKSTLQTLSLEILYKTDTMVMLDSSRDLSSRMKQPQLEFSEIMNNPNGFQLTSSSFDYHTSEANMGSSNIQRSVENSIKPSVHILQSDLPTSVFPSNGTRSINLMHTDNNDRALDSSYLQSSFSKSNMETSIFVDSFGNTNKQTREFQTSDGFTTTSLFTNFPKSSDFRSHEAFHALRDPSVDKVGSSSTVNISSSDVNSRQSNDTALSVPGTPDGFISTLLNFTTTIEAFTTNDTMTTLFEETTPIMVDIPVGSEGTTPIAEKPGVTPPKLKELEINLEGFIIPAVIAGVFMINLLGVILALAHRRKRRLKSEKSPSVRTTIVSDEDLEANSFRIPRPNILFPPYYVKENWGTWTSSHFNIYESSLFAQIDNIYDEIGKSRTSSNIHSTT